MEPSEYKISEQTKFADDQESSDAETSSIIVKKVILLML